MADILPTATHLVLSLTRVWTQGENVVSSLKGLVTCVLTMHQNMPQMCRMCASKYASNEQNVC